jgi:hypothetical protein
LRAEQTEEAANLSEICGFFFLGRGKRAETLSFFVFGPGKALRSVSQT